ncbi:MAG: DUF1761 domain-containing protein [Hyphomonadaceae bacterium]
MPRLGGTNIVAVLAAGAAIWIVGALFFGVVFTDIWEREFIVGHGLATSDAVGDLDEEAIMALLAGVPGQIPMGAALGAGFLVALIQAAGIATVLAWTRPTGLGAAIRPVIAVWAAFSATMLAYNVIYYAESRITFGIDIAHTLVAFMVGTVVIYLIDGKALRPASAPT